MFSLWRLEPINGIKTGEGRKPFTAILDYILMDENRLKIVKSGQVLIKLLFVTLKPQIRMKQLKKKQQYKYFRWGNKMMECIIGILTRKAIKPGLYIKVISFDTTTFCLVCNQVDCCVCIHKLCFYLRRW